MLFKSLVCLVFAEYVQLSKRVMSQTSALTPEIITQVLTPTKRASIAAERLEGETLNKEAQDLESVLLLYLLYQFYVTWSLEVWEFSLQRQVLNLKWIEGFK